MLRLGICRTGHHDGGRRLRRWGSALLALAVTPLAVVAPLGGSPVSAVTTTGSSSPSTSRGSSNNKALEIYNGTGASVDLTASNYDVQMFFNGVPRRPDDQPHRHGGRRRRVRRSPNHANAAILAQADQTNGAGWYNGDDAVVLRKGTNVVDVIGQIGFDPGTEWGTASPARPTTRCAASPICQGDPDGTNAFVPPSEWDGFANDTFDGLGCTHRELRRVDLAPAVPRQPGERGTGVPDADIVVTFSEPVTTPAPVHDRLHHQRRAHRRVTAGRRPTRSTPMRTSRPSRMHRHGRRRERHRSGRNDPPDKMVATPCSASRPASPPSAAIRRPDPRHPGQRRHRRCTARPSRSRASSSATTRAGPVRRLLRAGRGRASDANPATSEGIFVFSTNTAVNAGDKVRVKGR